MLAIPSISKKPFFALFIAAMSGLSLSWYLLRKEGRGPSEINYTSYLFVDPDALSLGERWEEDGLRVNLPILNRSEHPIKLDEVSSTCTCMVVGPTQLVIPAGETASLPLEISLSSPVAATPERGSPSQQDGQVEVAVLGPMTIESGLSQILHVRTGWKLTGQIRRAIIVSKVDVLCDGVAELSREPYSADPVVVKPLVPVAKLAATISHPDLEALVESFGENAKNYKVTVHERQRLKPGETRTHLTLTPFGPKGERLGSKRIQVRWRVEPDLRVSPPNVLFAASPIGNVLEEIVAFSSYTRREFEIRSMRASDETMSVSQAPSGPEGQSRWRITRRVAKAGQLQGWITATVKYRTGVEEEVKIPVSGYGLDG